MQTAREPLRSGLAAANCGECRRRKQKCNREWPCNRCHARKVPHLCHFGGSTTSSRRHERSGRARHVRCSSGPDRERDDGQYDTDDRQVEVAMQALSSASDLSRRSTTVVVIEQQASTTSTGTGIASQELQSALDILHSIDLTGLLVRHFLYGGNYYHYILYHMQFTDDYTGWLQDRKSGRPVSTAFTCLVLRVCACSAQYLPPEKKADVEMAYSQSSDELSRRFHEHAQRLGATISPGTGGLVQVQQMMLGVLWLQAESLWTASWHALGATIHEAQEQGMHLDTRDQNVHDFEENMQRQAWCLLCIWDWQSSIFFGRPPIINQNIHAARLPILQLYSPATYGSEHENSNALAASTHMLLQYQLVSRITRRFGDISLPLPVEAAMNVVSEVRDWLKAFPPAYAIPGRDPGMDTKHKWLAAQRTHLHTLAYIVILILLKPFIAKASSADAQAAEDGARKQGIDAAIAIMEINHALYNKLYPDSLQPNQIFFAVFSTSAVLCPAVMNDKNRTLPRRAEVIECIGKALDMLHRMSSERPIVETGSKALHKVALQLPLTAQETSILRRKHHPPGQRQLRQRHGGAVMDNVPSMPSLPGASSATQAIKRSESTMPDIGELPPLSYYPGPSSMLAPIAPYTPRAADTANSLMKRAPEVEATQGGEYMVQSSQVYAAEYEYPYSRLESQPFQQMPLAGPRYDGAVYGNEDGPENRNGSRNGGGSSADARMGAVLGLGIYDGPPPLTQTMPTTELHGLDAGFGGVGGLILGGAVEWPMEMGAVQQYLAQGPAEGQNMLLH